MIAMTIAMMINLLSGTKKNPEDPERTNRERVNGPYLASNTLVELVCYWRREKRDSKIVEVAGFSWSSDMLSLKMYW